MTICTLIYKLQPQNPAKGKQVSCASASRSMQNPQGAVLCYCFFPQVTSPLPHSWPNLKVAEHLGKAERLPERGFRTGSASHNRPMCRSSSLAPQSQSQSVIWYFSVGPYIRQDLSSSKKYEISAWSLELRHLAYLVICSTNDMQTPYKAHMTQHKAGNCKH